MEFFCLAIAFFSGLAVKLIGLPPLVGYLLAGFMLSSFGVQSEDTTLLKQLADFGITLMLFTIGLKLQFKDLWKKEVLLVGSVHMLISAILIALSILLITFTLPKIINLTLEEAVLIGFILSFSSTICALKILQESNAIDSRYGKISISILVLQDIFAVIFLVFSSASTPTIWAILLPTIILVKPILDRLINHSGHGELLFIIGILIALFGYYMFDLVNVKGDLGALIVGMLLSNHPKNNELVKSLVNFKDLLLIGFFLSIGLIGLPELNTIAIALAFALFIPIKYLLFYTLFATFKLRSRVSYLSSTLLSNYGEFGLIVTYIGVSLGILTQQWLTIMGVTVSISLIITSICYTQSHKWYYSLRPLLKKYQRKDVLPEDQNDYPKNIKHLIVGGGRIGSSALEHLEKLSIPNVWAIDANDARVKRLIRQGHNIFLADAEDSDFWQTINLSTIKSIIIALPYTDEILKIIEQLKKSHYNGKIITIAQYEDELAKLQQYGVHATFNIFQEAGAKLAEDSLAIMNTDYEKNNNKL